MYVSDVTEPGKSFMNITNNKGSKTDPCGFQVVLVSMLILLHVPTLVRFCCLESYLSRILLLLFNILTT